MSSEMLTETWFFFELDDLLYSGYVAPGLIKGRERARSGRSFKRHGQR
jgi:hypothetical protein